jgi:hypothetical protein
VKGKVPSSTVGARAAQPLDGMIALRAFIFGAALLAGCGDASAPHNLDDWIPLLAVQEPVRFSAEAQAVDDASCLKPEGVKVIGNIDAYAITEIIDAVRVKHARAAIVMVRGKGRYAEVWTGADCHAPGGPHGDIHHLRRDDSAWVLKETTQWVS